MSHQDAVVWYLRIEHQKANTVNVLTVTGRVSSLTAGQLERALGEAIGASGGVVLDLTGVDYISSPGLRAVADASTALSKGGRPFVVCGMKDPVSVAFGLGGLGGTLTIEVSREAAVARATSWASPAGETAC